MKDYTDKEILDCLRNRQSFVVRYLSERYMPMIRLMVYQRGGSVEDSKDIFQDGLIIIIDKIDRKELVLTCKFKTFFYTICEKLWLKVLEKRKAAANYLVKQVDDSSIHDFTEVYDNQLYENLFYDIFDTLDEGCKKLLKLYWQDFSPLEIAEKLGFTYGYLRKKKCNCMAEFIKAIHKNPEYKQIKRTEKMANSNFQ